MRRYQRIENKEFLIRALNEGKQNRKYVWTGKYLEMLSHFSRVWLFETLWTVAHQARLSMRFLPMRFSRQEYWSDWPFPPPGDLPDPGIQPVSPALQAGSLPAELLEKPTYMHDAKSLNCVWLFVTLWTLANQVPLSIGILQARILEWMPYPPPGDRPNPGIEPRPSPLQADSLPSELPGKSIISWLIGKDLDAEKDWRQEKGATQDELVGWHHWLNGHKSEQTQGESERQGSLVRCSPCGCRVRYNLISDK